MNELSILYLCIAGLMNKLLSLVTNYYLVLHFSVLCFSLHCLSQPALGASNEYSFLIENIYNH